MPLKEWIELRQRAPVQIDAEILDDLTGQEPVKCERQMIHGIAHDAVEHFG